MIRLRTLGAIDLRTDSGGDLRAVLQQPKRVALLTYLALATPRGFQRRDTLIALFWPELDAEHARGALRQAVRFLRRHLGDDVIVSRGEEELALGEQVWCDVVGFEQAASENWPEKALELYRGNFLAGFYISEAAPEFDQWVDSQRGPLRTLAARMAWDLTAKEELAGNASGAAHWARRAMALAPQDESALRQLMSLLDRLGDRAGALQVYEDFARELVEEYGTTPSAETKALAEAVRSRARSAAPAPASSAASVAGMRVPDVSVPGMSVPGGSVSAVAEARRGRRRGDVAWRRWAPMAFAALVVAVVALARRSPERPTVLAVGAIHDHAGAAGAGLTSALADLLATNLARIPGVHMVSTARLYEVLGQLGRFTDTGAAMARAARQAGASELLEGALYRGPDGTLRLDLRRVELGGGAVRHAFSAHGTHPFVLVDSATSDLARTLQVRAPALRVADVTTASLVAHRFYEEGLRAYYQGDARSGLGLFQAALAEDSSFAMAAYYVAISQVALGDENAARAPLIRAARLAERATERERLVIRTHLALVANEPEGLAMAETLAARYPTEPDGHLLVGQARVQRGDFLGALPHLRRVVEMDSLAFRGGAVRCRACDALGQISVTYVWADSFAAAERIVREAMRRSNAPGWRSTLAEILELQGRRDEALATFREAPGIGDRTRFRAIAAIRAGDFAEADRLLTDAIRAGPAELQGEALWFLAISLRYQGRTAEALAVARRLRRLVARSRSQLPLESLIEAQALFELGRARQAAALFDSIGRLLTDSDFPANAARHRTWTLTHVATSLAAAGDTDALARLVDSIAAYGRQSAYGRDQRLHHHVRGLLWRARGRPAESQAEFRRAIHSPTSGYTRTNLEFGRVLLELKRPREAIAAVAPALRGGLEASNLYVTHTELHELLAQAYDAADRPDSAAVHYRWVVNAWQHAEPPYRERLQVARRRLAALGAMAAH
jgi:DNA-binding SARP family transcriptional activator